MSLECESISSIHQGGYAEVVPWDSGSFRGSPEAARKTVEKLKGKETFLTLRLSGAE